MNSRRPRPSSTRNSNLDYSQLETRNLLASIETGLSFTSAVGAGAKKVHIAADVSTEHIVQFANNRLSIFNEADGAQVRSINSRVFWSEAGREVTDLPLKSQVMFTMSRWVVMAIDADYQNRILIAVSDSDDPTGGWQSTQFYADLTLNTSVVDFDVSAHYHNWGQAVIVSTTNNAASDNQQLFAIRNDGLLAETPVAWVIRHGDMDSQALGESIALSRQDEGQTGLLVNFEDSGTTFKTGDYRYNNYFRNLLISNVIEIQVPFYESAPAAQQPGGVIIDVASPGESVSAATDNRTVIAHNVMGSSGNAAIRWYVLNGQNVVDTGLLEDPGLDYFNPVVSVQSVGFFTTFSIAYTASGTNLFPSSAISMGYLLRDADALEVTFVEPGRIVQEGSAAYDNPDSNGLNRISTLNASATSQVGLYWSISPYSESSQTWATNVTRHNLEDVDFIHYFGDGNSFAEINSADTFGATGVSSMYLDAGAGSDNITVVGIPASIPFTFIGGDGGDRLSVLEVPATTESLTVLGGDGNDTITVQIDDLTFPVSLDGGIGQDEVHMQGVEGASHSIDADESYMEKAGSNFRAEYLSFEEYRLVGEVDIYTPASGTIFHGRDNPFVHTVHDPGADIILNHGLFETHFDDEMNIVVNRGKLILNGTGEADRVRLYKDNMFLNGASLRIRADIEFRGGDGDDVVEIMAESWNVGAELFLFEFIGGDGFDQVLVTGDDKSNRFHTYHLTFLDRVELLSVDLGKGSDTYFIRQQGLAPQEFRVNDSRGNDRVVFNSSDSLTVDLGPGDDRYEFSEFASGDVNVVDSLGKNSMLIESDNEDGVPLHYQGNQITFGELSVSYEKLEDMSIGQEFFYEPGRDDLVILDSPSLPPTTRIYLRTGNDTLLARSADLHPGHVVEIHVGGGNDVLKVENEFLAAIEYIGGDGEDLAEIELGSAAAGSIKISQDVEHVGIIGRDGIDSVVVRENSLISKSPDNQILRSIVLRGVAGERKLDSLDIDLNKGNDIATVYGSPISDLRIDGQSGRDYFWILDTEYGRNFLFDGGSGSDIFYVEHTAPNTFTTLRGHTQNDVFYLGSNQGRDDGNLGFLHGRIDLDAGNGDDWLYMNDNHSTRNFGYYVGNGFVGNQETNNNPARPEFRGIYFDSDLERLRLDANEAQNFFTVVPTMNTEVTVHGRAPVVDEGSLGIGDALYVAGANDGRSLVEFGQNNGIFSFTNGSEKIRYFSIEAVSRPAQGLASRSFIPTFDTRDDDTEESEFNLPLDEWINHLSDELELKLF